MNKFIVRDASGEFWKCLVASTMEEATSIMIETQSKIRAMGGNLDYTIEPAPVAEVFQNDNWMEEFNERMSRYHY